jgi:hypothetical protein
MFCWKKQPMQTKNKALSKEDILILITTEKNTYNQYMEYCSFYGINPDPIATARSSSTIQTLTAIISML